MIRYVGAFAKALCSLSEVMTVCAPGQMSCWTTSDDFSVAVTLPNTAAFSGLMEQMFCPGKIKVGNPPPHSHTSWLTHPHTHWVAATLSHT